MASEIHPKDVELPNSLDLVVGEAWTVRLPGLGSAGYEWSVQVSAPDVVSWAMANVDDERGAVEGAGIALPPDSSNVARQLTIEAKSRGTTTVAVILARSWETDTPPLRQHEIAVRVR